MIRFALIVASTLGFVLTAALGNLMTPLLRAFRVRQEENEPPTMGGLCLMVGTLAAVGVGWTAACVAQPELLGTESLLYPSGMKKKLSELAVGLSVTEKVFDLVTVKKRKYYVYRYEGNLNGIENAVVLLSYPEKAFGNPKAPEGLAKFRRK